MADLRCSYWRPDPTTMAKEQPPQGSHWPCDSWEGLCGSICRGSRVTCQQFSLLSVGGDILLESAGRGVWAGTPGPADCSPGNGRPSAVHQPRQLSPRTHTWPHEGKYSFWPLHIIIIKLKLNIIILILRKGSNWAEVLKICNPNI